MMRITAHSFWQLLVPLCSLLSGGALIGCDQFPGLAFSIEDVCRQQNDEDCDGYPAAPLPCESDGPCPSPEYQYDCDDDSPSIHPGQDELVCNGIDEDCDGEDSTKPITCYKDEDDDGHGVGEGFSTSCICPNHSIEAPLGNFPKDCDDTHASVYPGKQEFCDGLDNDCNGEIDNGLVMFYVYPDDDGDGYGAPNSAEENCKLKKGYVTNDQDCNDEDPSAFPGADETGECSEDEPTDLNCDGAQGSDDNDSDESPACNDCNDEDSRQHPDADEVCDNIDNDCDGNTDEDILFYVDEDGDGFGSTTSKAGSCDDGKLPPNVAYTSNDCDDDNALTYPGATTCQYRDEAGELHGGYDCGPANTSTEIQVGQLYYHDRDQDGYTDENDVEGQCFLSAQDAQNARYGEKRDEDDCDDYNDTVYPGAFVSCENENQGEINCGTPADDEGTSSTNDDNDNDGVPACSDCNDQDKSVYPGAREICNGIDDNCDNRKDNAGFRPIYPDSDSDGYFTSTPTSVSGCGLPYAYVEIKPSTADCNDKDDDINPDATETCDDKDNDCDGKIDDADTSVSGRSTWYIDADNDAFGSETQTEQACDPPAGYTSNSRDCIDDDSSVHPDQLDDCDGIDSNCTGAADEDCVTLTPSPNGLPFYQDLDKDEFGDPDIKVWATDTPIGYVSNDKDCDDKNSNINPDAPEICDDKDNDCDGSKDEDITYYRDGDGDGFGDESNTMTAGCNPPSGYVKSNKDCDDSMPEVNPGAQEHCNGIDDNCNKKKDEGLLTTFYFDADGDGFGVSSSTTQACSKPTGYATQRGDCDDQQATFYPGATDISAGDGHDANCDGIQDQLKLLAGRGWRFGNKGLASDGHLHAPYDSVYSSNEQRLYIADAFNNQVRYVDENGHLHTLAGTGRPGDSGDGGPALVAELSSPSGLALDISSGRLFVSDTFNARVRVIDLEKNTIQAYAGTGTAGASEGDGDPLTAELNHPQGLFWKGSSLYIADQDNHRILQVEESPELPSTLKRIAGYGELGDSGDGSLALYARLKYPADVVVDALDQLYISDSYNGRVRRVGADLIIHTLAGGGTSILAEDNQANTIKLVQPTGLALDDAQHLWVAERSKNQLFAVDLDDNRVVSVLGTGEDGYGDGETLKFNAPTGLSWDVKDTEGTLFIADVENQRIRSMQSSLPSAGQTTTEAGNGSFGFNGNHTSSETMFNFPTAVLAAQNALFIADTRNHRVRRLEDSEDSTVTLYAGTGDSSSSGDGDPATTASLNEPSGLALSSDGILYIAESAGHRVRAISSEGFISTVAGTGTPGRDTLNNIATETPLNAPWGLLLDAQGRLLIADSGNHRVLRLDDTLEPLILVAGTGTQGEGEECGADELATMTNLDTPQGLALDENGTLYITDLRGCICLVDPDSGNLHTLLWNGSETLSEPSALAMGEDGSLYVADPYLNMVFALQENSLVRLAGLQIETLSSGDFGVPGDSIDAQLDMPSGLWWDSWRHRLLIADANNHRLLALMP